MNPNDSNNNEIYSGSNNSSYSPNGSNSGKKYNQNYQYESHSESKYRPPRERGGLIPVTAHIINNADVTPDDSVEFQGVNIIDITAVGYVVDFKEIDNKINITLYDYTGLLNVNFYIRQENEDNSILDNFKYEGIREPVQIFGTVKVYKGEKSILGAKLIKSSCNYVLYHRANVIHSFLYLTGKLKENGGNKTFGQTNKNENIGGYSSHAKKNNDDMEEAINILNEYAKKDSQINAGKLEELFRKFGNKSRDIINKLVSENKLIDNDDFYEIIS